MVWTIAAGVIIAGGALGLVWAGLQAASEALRENEAVPVALGYGIALAGLAVCVWIVFFKAHFE